jgi:conserved oligomeric Golgi complex subunit 6
LEVVHSQPLAQLSVQKLQSQIHHDALVRLAKTYQMICEKVKKPENKYEAASTLLGSERPFGQVHLLWQIFGLEEEEEVESDDDETEEESSEERKDIQTSGPLGIKCGT